MRISKADRAGGNKLQHREQQVVVTQSTFLLLARGLLLSILVVLLFLSFSINGLGVAKWNQWASWEVGSSAMVLKKVESDLGPGEKSPFGLGGWSLNGDGIYDRLPQLEQLESVQPATGPFQPYISEIGGNGHFLSAVWRFTPCSSLTCLHGLNSLLFSITIVALFFLLGRVASSGFAWAWLLGMSLSPWIVMMGRNLFWSPWWWLLPAIAAALLSLSRSRLARICALMALWITFLLRYYMTGYHEFLPIILLACAICLLPMLFPTTHPRQRRTCFLDSGHVLLAGFVTPIPIVLIHASFLSTSISEGLERLWQHLVVRRSWGETGDDISPIGVLWQYLWSDWWTNFLAIAVDRQGSLWALALGPQMFIVAIILALVIITYRGFTRERKFLRDLVLFSLGFASAGMWLIAARNYAYYQTPILYFVWYFLFVPSLLFVIGDFVWQWRIPLSRYIAQGGRAVTSLLWPRNQKTDSTHHLMSISDSIDFSTSTGPTS